jgi:hypothetical protein
MNLINLYITHLQKNPQVGIISGFGSTGLFIVHQFLTDEANLKLVAAVGAYAATFVAILSFFSWTVKVWDQMISRHKNKQNEKH